MASLSSSSAAAAPPWAELPPEIMAAILRKFEVFEILAAVQNVCTTWRRVCRDPAMWRRIDLRPYTGDLKALFGLNSMCRQAVNLSQGQLTDIIILHVGSDDNLLLYIAQRSSRLRRLQLVNVHITSGCLIEAVKSLPLLEELHLYYNANVDAETVENIGLSCPILTSFKPVRRKTRRPLVAQAIARTMPQLCHLQLIGHMITNDGLKAILDGCPRLESLDLRRCTNVRIAGELERICSQRIKDPRLPSDPLDDYQFLELHNDESYFYEELDELSRLLFDMGF